MKIERKHCIWKRPFQKPDSRKLEETVMGHIKPTHYFKLNNYRVHGPK